MIRLEPIRHALPAGLEAMRTEARAEHYNMLETLVSEWQSGKNRFEGTGEALLAAYSDEVLAGIGGVTIEAGLTDAFRMRRFYVRQAYRRGGVARLLAMALLEGLPVGRPVTVNAGRGSGAFWQALGFAPVRADGWTHVLQR